MATYYLPFFGERDFETTPDNYWRFTLSQPGAELIVIVALHAGTLADGLQKANSLFTSIKELEQTARRTIRAEYDDSPSTSAYFVRYFTERYAPDEVHELFGTEADGVGVDELLHALHLKAIRFNLGQTTQFLAAEFRLDADQSEQRLVIYFDSNGVVETVSMES